jgi:demethylmenaquinone methyltransferase/2-methoxy-6-polyprenyl-1,4-benzoquinol methylase
VIHAIEVAIPEYDRVNDRVSLGQAMKAREYAADRLKLKEGMTVLDAGIGPGTMSEVILSRNSALTIIGLDASIQLLHAARERFRSRSMEIHFVRATFEAVPVRDGSINRIVSAYAFRDSRNLDSAIDEFQRILVLDGSFGIVDLGKPDNALKRSFITVYIRYFMPLIAHFSKSDRIRGNPWRMIFPTYQLLLTNAELEQTLLTRFAKVQIWEFLLGGVVVVFAQRGPLAASR